MHASSLQHHVAIVRRTANHCRNCSLAEHHIPDFVRSSSYLIRTLHHLLLSQPSSAQTIFQHIAIPLITILTYRSLFSPRFTPIRTHALLLFVPLCANCNPFNHHAALYCLRTVAHHASAQDVRIILTAPLQIAVAQNARYAFMRFLPLAPRPDRFLPALEAILRGFATNALLHHCSPLQYMRIVSALALAVDAKMAALPTRAPAFVSALQQVFTRVLADQRGRPALPSQLFLAFAAVVLHADPASRKDESAAARPTSTSAESAISFVRKTVAELQQPLANFSEQPELLCFESRNRSTIATVFVVCTIPRFVADYLPPAQIALIRRALELCMRTSLNQPEQIPSTHFVFHKQLCKCISEYPTTLASAHAQFIHTERACETNRNNFV